MSVVISNGSISITVKPETVIRRNRYAVKVVLSTVTSLGIDSEHVELMFSVTESDLASDNSTKVLDFLNSLPDYVEVTSSDILTVPTGTYYVEDCEIRITSKRRVYDVRLSMFRG